MLNTIITSMLLFSSFVHGSEHIELSLGPHYANYRLRQNEEEALGKWHFGGEIGIANFIPNIGIKIRGSKLQYTPGEFTQLPYTYEYTPLTFCTSFNLLPFLQLPWLKLSLETGIGVYSWKGLDNSGQVVTLPTGDTIEERDIGFVAGLTVQLRPLQFVGLEFASRYHYITSAEIYKYGFDDKDDTIWENGVGVKVIIPLLRR
jgi:hypothetical protein